MINPSNTEIGDRPPIGDWESEGGSLRPGAVYPVPDGVTAETVVRYHVGPYSYTRLEDALAEHRRQSRKPGSLADNA